MYKKKYKAIYNYMYEYMYKYVYKRVHKYMSEPNTLRHQPAKQPTNQPANQPTRTPEAVCCLRKGGEVFLTLENGKNRVRKIKSHAHETQCTLVKLKQHVINLRWHCARRPHRLPNEQCIAIWWSSNQFMLGKVKVAQGFQAFQILGLGFGSGLPAPGFRASHQTEAGSVEPTPTTGNRRQSKPRVASREPAT